MPNIQEYNSTAALQGIRPNELGADALAQSGRRIGAVTREAGQEIGGAVSRVGGQIGEQIDRHNTTEEISAGGAAIANLQSQLTDQWNQTANTSDLNDHTIADQFREKSLEPAIEQWVAGFHTEKGQEWALSHADALRNHFFEKTTADMATRAGDALVANIQTTLNASSNMAMKDPSSMGFAMDTYESALRAAAANSNADPSVVSKVITEQVEKGKKQIAQSAMIGLAQNNPDALDAAVAKGTFNNYVDGAETKQMQAFAHSQRLQQKAEFSANSKDVADQYTNDMYDPTTQQVRPVTPQIIGSIMSRQDMTENDKRSTVRFLQQQFKAQQAEIENEQKAHSDPQVLAGFRARFLTANPPTKEEVGTAMGAGLLSSPDGHDLLTSAAALNDPKDPVDAALLKSAIKTGHANLLGSTEPGDVQAADQNRIQRFDAWFYPTYNRLKAQGKTPQQLLSPDSPDYLLKPENMRFFATNGDDLVSGAKQDYGSSAVAVPLIPPAQTGGGQQQKAPSAAVQRKPLAAIFGGPGGQ